MSVRAMLARVQRLEQARSPASPFVRWFGSLEAWEADFQARVSIDHLDPADMVFVMMAVRRWHADGVFAQ